MNKGLKEYGIDLSTLEKEEQEIIIKYYELDNKSHQLAELENEYGFSRNIDGFVKYVKSLVKRLPKSEQEKLKSL